MVNTYAVTAINYQRHSRRVVNGVPEDMIYVDD